MSSAGLILSGSPSHLLCKWVGEPDLILSSSPCPCSHWCWMLHWSFWCWMVADPVEMIFIECLKRHKSRSNFTSESNWEMTQSQAVHSAVYWYMPEDHHLHHHPHCNPHNHHNHVQGLHPKFEATFLCTNTTKNPRKLTLGTTFWVIATMHLSQTPLS